MTNLLSRIRAALLEGIYRQGEEFVVSLGPDNRTSDVIFVHKPMQRGDVFAAFSVNRHRTVPGELSQLKADLKYLRVNGEWEEMLDLAAKAFVDSHDISQYSAVITMHPPGGTAPPLACNLLASLEPYLAPGTRVLRHGFAKSSLDAVHVDDEAIERRAPAGYTAEQITTLRAKVKANFASAMKRAKTDGRFRVQNIIPQFRKFISGMVQSNAADLHGRVLFIDDYHTTGSTFTQIKATLPDGVQADCFVLLTA